MNGKSATMPTSLTLAYWRLLHPLPSLMTVFAVGAFILLAARGVPPIDTLLYLLLIETCRQFSISAFNDYYDRHVDQGRPDKPIASGHILPRIAWLIGAAFGLLSLLLAALFSIPLLVLTAVGLGGGLLYDVGLKYTAFSWLPFSVAFPTLPLWAWVGAHPDGDIPSRLLWVLPVGAVIVLVIHLADTIPDLASDTQAGVRGLAHRLGMSRSIALAVAAGLAGLLLTLALWPLLNYRAEWYLPGAVVGVLLMLVGVLIYLKPTPHLKLGSFLLETGALTLSVGWIGGLIL
jgi:4-hydroxybenzoate polyprenyltransferase